MYQGHWTSRTYVLGIMYLTIVFINIKTFIIEDNIIKKIFIKKSIFYKYLFENYTKIIIIIRLYPSKYILYSI